MRLPFELDPQIIHHIIYSQAGSIGKAIIELLMNSVDAKAGAVTLVLNKDGFECTDDGAGFVSKEDVLRYFGRFGTPHVEGDATYGRFRLGRGQIMAHASTVWTSNAWRMTVDTRAMGYEYDLDDLHESEHRPGCAIKGKWYEPLNDSEWMSAIQEIKDLVRYTPIRVMLNGKQITRDPRQEKWDAEDEFAWYRVKEDGAVSIYNQGVLVRHDSSHLWGAGGLIVSKKAVSLNVSRTEILRKNCPVWKGIAKQFQGLCDKLAKNLGEHRKTEARREKSARALLAGGAEMLKILNSEEVITLLPGKRHVSLDRFLGMCRNPGEESRFTITGTSSDVPKGEAIARAGIVPVVHHKTLDRFGCHTPRDFVEALETIRDNAYAVALECQRDSWDRYNHWAAKLVSFRILKEAFLESSQVVSELEALDKETRRAWTALRWTLWQYAMLITGGERWYSNRIRGGINFKILLGESNAADAWTDGKTYIAINAETVRKLKAEPLRIAAFIFSLVEHEVAHEGDSLDCGHDGAFYQRYHDISVKFSESRQRYMHVFLMKYTTSLEREGAASRTKAWSERYLIDRVGSGRVARGLPKAIGDVTGEPGFSDEVPAEDLAFMQLLNQSLVTSGATAPPPRWPDVLARAQEEQERQDKEYARQAAEQETENARWIEENADLIAEYEREHEEAENEMEAEWQRAIGCIAEVLGVAFGDVEQAMCRGAAAWLHPSLEKDELLKAWNEQEWMQGASYQAEPHDSRGEAPEDSRLGEWVRWLEPEVRALIRDDENQWSLERNAAAAGFRWVGDYLCWRRDSELV
ncbi:TPA: ATP-binding protein [Pseudomonas aeruginosa]|nr:ATP-binding protein [Pseudomonas aeruginosa]